LFEDELAIETDGCLLGLANRTTDVEHPRAALDAFDLAQERQSGPDGPVG
jgi:hypothetical protein